jgi:hypothetical protein
MFPDIDDRSAELAEIVAQYGTGADRVSIRTRLESFAATSSPDALVSLARPYHDDPHVIAPLYERVVAANPDNAQFMVVLANAYWLEGRGPEIVGELASRAIEADGQNRGAWHLWALSEPEPRRRVRRWEQVTERFPDDDLALAAVADNAAAVAGAERDYEMLDVSIQTYDLLLQRATDPTQRDAVENALRVLRGWRF